MRSSALFVANWKMNKSFNRSLSFSKHHKEALSNLCAHVEIVLCPSFVALYPLITLYQDTNRGPSFGAQNCSSFPQGSYTGEVDAQSLHELGASYCIIGHSERRLIFNESNTAIVAKMACLIDVGIQPIVCIGETHQEYMAKKTPAVIESQLTPLLKQLSLYQKPVSLCIAYEPVWAIGTGLVPDTAYLIAIYAMINDLISRYSPLHSIRLLYGGSVNPENANLFFTKVAINGFLIGGASLDFQKFEKIVSLHC